MSKANHEYSAPIDIDIKSVSEQGVFEGYASVFNVIDSHSEIVVAGAFAKSLASRPASKVKMLWQHSQSDLIGVWESIDEDAKGLKVRGRLMLDIERGRSTHALMKAGQIDSLSIGFKTVRDRLDKTKGARILEEIDLWEISAVTFPSNAEATVSAVKSTSTNNLRALVDALNSARSSLKG